MSDSRRRRVLMFLCLAIFCALFGLLGIFFYLSRPLVPRVVACAIGQGDALLFSYGHQHILLDTGRNSAIKRCLQANISFLDRTIDVVILTHGDADHIGGFPTVVESYTVNQVLTNDLEKNSEGVAFVQEYLAEHPQVIQAELPGSALVAPGWRARVVWSKAYRDLYWNQSSLPGDENGGSVGLSFSLQSFGFLSLGDLECPAELAVTTISLLNTTDFLKISHHGSKFSTCQEFLAKVRPEIGLISVGKDNSYGHPGENVVKNLEIFGVTTYRTDRDGDLIWWLLPNGGIKREFCAPNDPRCRHSESASRE